MVSLSLISGNFFLIDTSSIMAFSGADFTNPHHYLAYRDKIWTYLETIIDTEQLKTVRHVWAELEWNDPDSANRLKSRKNKFVLPKEDDIEIGVGSITNMYPGLVDANQSYAREDADPYLIIYAKKWNVQIITDEKPLNQRIGKGKNRHLKIPDVCQYEKMKPSVCLEVYLKAQGIIPNDFH